MRAILLEKDLDELRKERPSIDIEEDIYILDDDNLEFDRYRHIGEILRTKENLYVPGLPASIFKVEEDFTPSFSKA